MAIALDSSADLGAQTSIASTYTASYTITSNTNGVLVVGVIAATSDLVTGVTYNGVAMTLVGKGSGYDRYGYLWILVGPASGANNVVVSVSSSCDYMRVIAASYTGCAQTGQPDDSVTGIHESDQVMSMTTTADNCWLVGWVHGTSGTPSAGTGTTMRHTFSGGGGLCDSNGAITPAGACALTTAMFQGRYIAAALAPSGGGGGSAFVPQVIMVL